MPTNPMRITLAQIFRVLAVILALALTPSALIGQKKDCPKVTVEDPRYPYLLQVYEQGWSPRGTTVDVTTGDPIGGGGLAKNPFSVFTPIEQVPWSPIWVSALPQPPFEPEIDIRDDDDSKPDPEVDEDSGDEPPCNGEPPCGCGACGCLTTAVAPPKVGVPKPVMEMIQPNDPGTDHNSIAFLPGSGMFVYRKHTGAPGTVLTSKEIRHVDGTINFYQSYGAQPRRWRITKSIDPYDNQTVYVYSGGRLARIEYPDGIDEVFNFSPSWIGTARWPAVDYSGVEVCYEDRITHQVIAGRTRQYVYHKRNRVNHGTVPINPSTNSPYETDPLNGDLLYRAYVQAGRILDPIADAHANELYAVPPGLDAPERWDVTQYNYVEGTALVQTISHLVSDGILSPSETAVTAAVTYAYQGVGNRARVVSEALHLQEITYTYAYALRAQVDEYNQQSVAMTTKTGSDGSQVVYSMDTRGRVTSVKVWPRVGSGMTDRAADPAYDPAYDSQPTYLETLYEYDSLFCGCNGKPTAVVRMPANRRTEYQYEQTTGLLLEIREPNPSGSGTPAVTTYDWEPAVVGQTYGRWRLKSMTLPDGKQWSWLYPNEVARSSATWGTKSQVVVALSPTVSLSTPAPQVYGTSQVFNVDSPDLNSGSQLKLVGQIEQSIDADGVATAFTYDGYGRLEVATRNPGGALGDEELKTVYVRDRWGDVSTVTENAGSALPLTTQYTRDAGGRIAKIDADINNIPHTRRLYYDHWGNLGAVWTSNRTAAGGMPDDFDPNGPRSDIARDWIREEWHYVGGRLAAHFSDRRQLDRDDTGAIADADDARYLRTDYTYFPSGLLAQVGNSNGSTTDFSYDEFGDLVTVVRNGAGQSVLVSKRFVNAALETSRVIDGLGQVTVTERNAAGRVWRITDPSNAVPAGAYPWGVAPATVTELSIDVMGRVSEALVRELGGSLPLVRYKSLYDEIGRTYATETFEGASTSAIQSTTTLWNGASTIEKVTYPGQRFVEYEYDTLLRVRETRDGLGNPNKTLYSYEPKTPYLTMSENWGWDSTASTPGYVKRPVEYVRDNLGRTLQLKVLPSDPLPPGASSTPLVHWFSYYTTGGTESYVDPSGKFERYLPDGQGRLVERFLPGADPIWNGTQYADWLPAGGRTEMVQLDGRGRVTRTIYDFAGRPIVVMEPGASTEPTDASKNQPFARWIEYDAASRVSDIYAGDGVHVAFARDAQGRVLKRSGAGAQWVSLFHEVDWFQRDALGQVIETQTFGGGALLSAERFTRDVLGRTHEESFAYWPGFGNWTDTESIFAGGDALRSGVTYANNLAGKVDDVWIDIRNDIAGRLDRLQWKVAESDPWKEVATYKLEGPRTRERRTTSLTTSASFETAYSYDQYGRTASIDQSFAVNAGVKFHFDDASNLVKEEYKKQGNPTAKGDRFEYDEHHRLWKGWLGSNTAHFDHADPNAGVGDYVRKLTYALDSANNRDSVATQLGQGAPTTTAEYTADDEDPSHPSNRYFEADGVKPLYDERGNTVFDGQRYYVYDSLNRLAEVYVVDEQQQATGGGSTQSAMTSSPLSAGASPLGATTGGPLVLVEDVTALRQARANILLRLGGSVTEVLVSHGQPNFRTTASEPLSPSVAQVVSPSGSGATQAAPSGGSLSSATSSASAPSWGSLQLRLIAVYSYDTYDRRVIRMVDGWPIYYYAWDGWEEAQEMVATTYESQLVTRPVTQNVWGRELDEMVAYRNRGVAFTGAVGSWNGYYIAEGGAHCPSRVLDGSGAVVEIQEYDPYGKTTFFDGTGTPLGEFSTNAIWHRFHWKGQRVDWETGLVYMRHRYYSPEWGRFVSPDPLGVWGDGAGRGSGYSYVGNNPLSRWDPLGLQEFSYHPSTGWSKTGDVVSGWRAEGGADIKSWEEMELTPPDKVQVNANGRWRDLSISEKSWLNMVLLQRECDRLFNLTLAEGGMLMGAWGSTLVPSAEGARAPTGLSGRGGMKPGEALERFGSGKSKGDPGKFKGERINELKEILDDPNATTLERSAARGELGEIAVEAAERSMASPTQKVLTQVQVETEAGGYFVADIVVVDQAAAGARVSKVVEVKTGNGDLTPAQSKHLPELERSGGRVRSARFEDLPKNTRIEALKPIFKRMR